MMKYINARFIISVYVNVVNIWAKELSVCYINLHTFGEEENDVYISTKKWRVKLTFEICINPCIFIIYSFTDILIMGLEKGLTAFAGKEYIIVLEENLEVTPDFLHYFGQTLHLLDKDETILTVSAWNQNGKMKTQLSPNNVSSI